MTASLMFQCMPKCIGSCNGMTNVRIAVFPNVQDQEPTLGVVPRYQPWATDIMTSILMEMLAIQLATPLARVHSSFIYDALWIVEWLNVEEISHFIRCPAESLYMLRMA